jgi:hypothetical protein
MYFQTFNQGMAKNDIFDEYSHICNLFYQNMTYINQEEYRQATLLLPNPNQTELGEISVKIASCRECGSISESIIYFTRVLFCDSPRIPEVEYKWLLDKRYNQLD